MHSRKARKDPTCLVLQGDRDDTDAFAGGQKQKEPLMLLVNAADADAVIVALSRTKLRGRWVRIGIARRNHGDEGALSGMLFSLSLT